jgi:IMP cyclohydrolase
VVQEQLEQALQPMCHFTDWKVHMESRLKLAADRGLYELSENPYPGRGIVLGVSESGEHFVQTYWVMGRSDNSRNRVFVSDENGCLSTKAADPSKVENPSLIIYDAMRERGEFFVVSNGHQTNKVIDALGIHLIPVSLATALRDFKYEPDPPICTPRITGLCKMSSQELHLSILKKSPFGDGCDRAFWEYKDVPPGLGLCITTYATDGVPPPSFQGEPYLVPLVGDITAVRDKYWDTLNDKNRVSLAVKFINRMTHRSTISLVNRFTEVEAPASPKR